MLARWVDSRKRRAHSRTKALVLTVRRQFSRRTVRTFGDLACQKLVHGTGRSRLESGETLSVAEGGRVFPASHLGPRIQAHLLVKNLGRGGDVGGRVSEVLTLDAAICISRKNRNGPPFLHVKNFTSEKKYVFLCSNPCINCRKYVST